nr:PH domain-containing protein [Paenibacillus darwinianus]
MNHLTYQQPQQSIDRNALKAWRISGMISAAVYAVVLGILLFLTLRFQWPAWIFTAASLAAVTGVYVETVLFPNLRWKHFRYDIHEHEIDLQYGIFIRRRVLIPMVKVQHVDTKQGPLLRRYGLATVTFSTAAGSHEIPALNEARAEQVRNRIALLARISDEEI